MLDDYAGTRATIGPPGCGKTTYLATTTRQLVDWSRNHNPDTWQSDILLCSLTKAAAAEIAGRDLPLPARQVGTLHSHAYHALGSPTLTEDQLDDFNREHPTMAVSTSKGGVDDPKWDRASCQLGDELEQLYGLYRARKVPRPWPNRVQAFADVWEQWKADADLMDFADLIDNAFNETVCAPGAPSIICVDEAQDLSRAEHDLITKWGMSAGHVILVGDPDQAIYEWRGAAPNELYSGKIPNEHRRVLGQSYRVPRAVHALSQRWRQKLRNPYPIEYLPRDADGAVVRCGSSYKEPGAAIGLAEERLAAGKSVMIIASCDYLIKPTVTELRRRSLPFSNPWRRKRGDWNPLAPKHGTSMTDRIIALLCVLPSEDGRMWTWNEVERWSAPLAANLIFQPRLRAEFERLAKAEPDEVMPNAQIEQLMNPDALDAFVSYYQKTANDDYDVRHVVRGILAWWRDRMLPSKQQAADYPIAVACTHGLEAIKTEPKLFVGTGHSFKGSEADVVIVYPDISPAGYREWENEGTRDAVVRLGYVMVTRAREEVVICQPAGLSMPLECCMEN